jgi:preprotein translocase subunit YajC
MANNKQQTQMKAIAILIGIICLIVAMNKSMIVLFAVLITPILLLAYGGIYLMLIRNQKKEEGNHNELIRNQKKEEGNHNELINWYYNQVNKR